MNLTGRVALVTGGSRGIGRAIVARLAGAGAKVAFVYQSNQEAAEALAAELKAQGSEVLAIKADVSSKEEADQAVEQVTTAFGRLDILVNNAGITRDGLLATMTSDQWRQVIDTNLTGVFNFCQAATRTMMSQRYGRVINMSSVAADFSNPGQVNYAASKAGIEGFSRCMATELAKRGVTVNCVAPGFIETDMTVAVVNSFGDKIKQSIPVRRLGKPEDIANAVHFLASEESSYITGQTLKVDGGLTLGGMG
ncbi:3-oxoacyl-[acyl-carrier-protein] reductase [Planctellipticum variicoloris]|uniref:3-oxoacyl-[acyl-carrier-protein] reductase n=1 Tax=Planctellipticum variicoloris TaxID=3064265 RepID=UPI003013B09B|nr:3-oxoacyl-[acyl-carrier-protein] reductase [Planctomycetaceae bacterium SH412]